MNAEHGTIKDLVEGSKAIEWVVARVQNNVEGTLELPTKDEFWKQLVLALLTSQQPSTKGSRVDSFAQRVPFPLALQFYESTSDDEVRRILESFRFGKLVTNYLRKNHAKLFGQDSLWSALPTLLEDLLGQRNSSPILIHKNLERELSHFLARHLEGIGPKQSRNLLQELGLTRYEIPLDSRVTSWLQENLGWYIPKGSLDDATDYEFWLDRLQAACEVVGVLPTVFDASAFDKAKTRGARKGLTTCIGYTNKNGQVLVRNTRLPGTDHGQTVYQLGCSHCGRVYGANGSDIFERKCPKCQGGLPGLDYEAQ